MLLAGSDDKLLDIDFDYELPDMDFDDISEIEIC